jgi:RNA polymerase sigma-70 factor (ECF subfamily)
MNASLDSRSEGKPEQDEGSDHDLDHDARLMLAVQQGNDACFEQLFQKYKRQMINFAYRFTNRRDVAEELAQEIFIKCYGARASYEPAARFSTWLYRIARNHCLNEVRRPEYRHGTEPLLEEARDSLDDSPEDQFLAKALQQRAMKALAALPEKQRTALILCRFQHLSYQEIGATMKLSLAAVKSLLNRAKENLVAELGEAGGPGHEV